ncbi:alpha-amylase family glycosyl hydrolase [Pontibacter rugosus]
MLFSLPGTPMIQYGSEIGMGDDLSQEGRKSVRTPMQWTTEKNAGFSSAPVSQLPRPVISKGDYAYTKVNVVQQQRETNSLLNWMERVIRLRRQYPELGTGKCDILETKSSKIFAHSCTLVYTTVVVHNLSNEDVTVLLPILDQEDKYAVEVFSNDDYSMPKKGQLSINAYGYRWFRLNPATGEKKTQV